MAKFTCNFISYTLKRTVDITVVVPSVTIPESLGMVADPKVLESLDLEVDNEGVTINRHSKEHKYPVLYMLHGYGNNHATWTGYTNIELYAEERNIAIVMISAENKFYIDSGADLFFKFIEDELPDFICGMFPISRKSEDTYLAGLSMGGFGTLVHALSNPEKYAALGAFSAAVNLSDDMRNMLGVSISDEYNIMELAKKINCESKSKLKMYISCGKDDFLYDANLEASKLFIEMGFDVNWVDRPNYGHEWRFWDIEAEAFLDWIPRSDYYAGTGKRQI